MVEMVLWTLIETYHKGKQKASEVDIGVSQNQGNLLGVPMIRIVVFCCLFRGPPTKGNYLMKQRVDRSQTASEMKSEGRLYFDMNYMSYS